MNKPLFLASLLLCSGLAGCMTSSPSATTGDSTTEDQLKLPTWQQGESWLYTFVTPQFGEDTARLVVAEVDEEEQLYYLGISNEREAQRHAVINHNPFLGRVTMQGLSVFENGEAQPVFQFPWSSESDWTFTLLGQTWDASVQSIKNGVISVVATSADGHTLAYQFDTDVGFISSFVWSDDEDVEQLNMVLTQHKFGYTGDVFFYRARDLLDQTYTGSDTDLYDSFIDSGHPDGSEWDVLVWYIDASIAQGGSGALVMKDHLGASPLTRTWGSNAQERGALGTIPSVSGEYGVTVSLRGQSSMLHFKVAGAVTFRWTL